jgi:chaperone required for assembly of F1-ATPase
MNLSALESQSLLASRTFPYVARFKQLDAIIEKCKPAQTFKQVVKLEIDFDSVKRTILENFASLFSSETLRSLTITKRNVNIFPYLVENKIKVNHLHLEMPLAALIPYMNRFLHFT